eukprot:TRINITY_DN2718_c0_g1_i1.p1 TRINITY_DN2718_c0_g1~~TRINITY_DN2718_c0_g1_i1.p1  ORF type:complete len:306 (-),score=80.57 TRINITY_DN2718_c0_g1_i1:51-968(-)
MYKEIICPIDSSKDSENALHHAVDVAKQSSANLHIIHVVPSFVGSMEDAMSKEAEAIFEQQDAAALAKGEALLKQAKDYALSQGVNASTEAIGPLIVDPTEIIVQKAKERNVDLIVMATHNRHGISRALVGSVTEGVLKEGIAPVLVSKGTSSSGARKHHRILVPIDGSDSSRQALSLAAKLASSLGGDSPTVVVFHVIEVTTLMQLGFAREGTESTRQHAQKLVDESVAALKAAGIQDVLGKLGTSHHASEALIEESEGYDIVVMGSRGLRPLHRLKNLHHIGSVTQALIRGAQIPVLATAPPS